MTPDQPDRPRLLRYGVEAPYVPALMLFGAIVSLFLTVATGNAWWLVPAVLLLLQTAVFLNTTLRGKHHVWSRELDRLALAGDERLLDLGCGSGAVLVAAAQRLPRGRAEGIDLWRSVDQSGNDLKAAQANATAAGVADVVTLHTGDMTDLPFPDATFDVVTSALAVHNIKDRDGRRKAVEEAVRVLKPGGRLALVDFKNVKDYAADLGPAMVGAQIRGLGWEYWYGGPWTAGSILAATKQ